MSRHPLSICIAIGMAWAAVGQAACPDHYTFEVVAETGSAFAALDPLPALSERGLVAFRATLSGGGQAAYTGTRISTLELAVQDLDAEPGSEIDYIGRPIAGDAGLGQAAIPVRIRDGLMQTWPAWVIARRGTPGLSRALESSGLRPESPFQAFADTGTLLADGSLLTHATGLAGDVSIVRAGVPTSVQVLYSGSVSGRPVVDSAPDGPRTGALFGFLGYDPLNAQSVIVRDLTGGPIVVRRADDIEAASLGTPIMSDGGSLAYWEGYRAAPPPSPLQFRLIRHAPDSIVTVLADSAADGLSDRSDPWRGRRGCVGFSAIRSASGVAREGLFQAGSPRAGESDLYTVISRGDALLGGVVLDVSAGNRGGNQAGQLAFWALLSAGATEPQKEVIVLATPTTLMTSGFEGSEQGSLPGNW